jgi:hypothetical protein
MFATIPPSGVPALLTWLFPGLLWGAVACSAPVIIHLLLRPRPRPQIFPALRLLLKAQKSDYNRSRLRHLLLLLMRVALLILLAAALARPVLRGTTLAVGTREPTSAVFCVDDSASMGYVFQGRTRLDLAFEYGGDILRDARRFPPGSQVMIVRTSAGQPGPWLSDTDTAARTLSSASLRAHDRGLVGALSIARAELADLPPGPKEIYVLTDNTRRAWDDVLTVDDADYKSDESVGVYVFDVGQKENRNASVLPRWPARFLTDGNRPRVPPGRDVEIGCTVTAGEESLDARFGVWIDGAPQARGALFHVEAEQMIDVSITIPGQAPGPHWGAIRLDHGDALPADNQGWIAFEAADRGRVAVMSTGHDANADVEARRMATLLSPPSLPPERRPFEVDLLTAVESLSASELARYAMVVLVEPRAMTAESIAALGEWCGRGGLLVIVCGPAMDLPMWRSASATANLGASPIEIVDSREGTSFARLESLPAGLDDDDLLGGHHIERYVRLRPASALDVRRTLTNGDPVILEHARDAGRVVWWAFSLRNDWSDLGVRAGAILVALHDLAASTWTTAPRAATVGCDAPLELSAARPNGTRPATLTIARMSDGDAADSAAARVDAQGRFVAPTMFGGAYRATPTAGARRRGATDDDDPILAAYAVNLHPAESDARRLDDEAVLSRFPPASAVLLRSPDDLRAPTLRVAGDRELGGDVLVAVLALLLLESAASRRALRSAAPEQRGSARG